MKQFKCTYPIVEGYRIATIKLDNVLLETKEFQDLNDAINWTNSYCEGFRKSEELK